MSSLGNPICWFNTQATFERCCLPDTAAEVRAAATLPAREAADLPEECWSEHRTADLCCHPVPAKALQCYLDMEGRVSSKLGWLGDLKALQAHTQAWPEHLPGREETEVHARVYESMLAQPLTLWAWACTASMGSPLLWSDECACCDPPAHWCLRDSPEVLADVRSMRDEFVHCCFPMYARRVAGVDPVDDALERSLIAHIRASGAVSRAAVVEQGPRLRWPLAANFVARGCLVTVRGGLVQACEEAHACSGFDCSYLRAFLLTLRVLSSHKRLPDLDLVLNAGDLTMDAPEMLPVFTRVGTRWTNTIALPVEWQLHPGQCRWHVREATQASWGVPWARRAAQLVWRGSNSNCVAPRCEIAAASDRIEEMQKCAHLHAGEARNCQWTFATWLQFPRGRLVWLSRFIPDLVDAKFVHTYDTMASDLVAFLRGEGLLGKHMSIPEQAAYKYSIAVEGDSAADRLWWQLFTGQVVIVPDGPWRHLNPVMDLLEPWVHFVPVRYDLVDLAERIRWLQQHDEEAQTIAKNAVLFAQRYLTCDAIAYYVDRLLRTYADALVD